MDQTTAPAPAPADGIQTRELADVMRRRSSTYALLARLFRTEVDQACLDGLHAMRFPVATGNARIDEGNRLIARFMSNVWANTLEELAVDYVRVFIGHGVDGHSAAYPFESVYTSEKRLLMQDARDEVLAVMRSEGLDKARDWPDSEDHAGLELEFMGTLADRTAAALEAGDEDEAVRLLEVQRAFVEGHLRVWLPLLAADMLRLAQTDLYRGLAELTVGFVEEDRALLEALLGPDENASGC